MLALVPVSGPGTTCAGLVEAPTVAASAAAAAVDTDPDTCAKDSRRRPGRHRRRLRVVMFRVQFHNNVGDTRGYCGKYVVACCACLQHRHRHDEPSLLMIVLGGKPVSVARADCAKIWATPKICCLHAVCPPIRHAEKIWGSHFKEMTDLVSKIASKRLHALNQSTAPLRIHCCEFSCGVSDRYWLRIFLWLHLVST